MQEKHRVEFGRLMFTVAEVTGRDISESSIELYWRLLSAYEFADIEHAVHAHLMNPDTGQFFPKPADIERAIQGDTKSQALEAWSIVRTAIRSVGAYESVTFDDQRIQAAVADMGDWPSLCRIPESELPFKAQEFQQRFRAYTLNPPLHWPAKLVGIIEQENASAGYLVTNAPRAVGSLEGARLVYLLAGGEEGKEPRMPDRVAAGRERPLPVLPEEQAAANRKLIGQMAAGAVHGLVPTRLDPEDLRQLEQVLPDSSFDENRRRALEYLESRMEGTSP